MIAYLKNNSCGKLVSEIRDEMNRKFNLTLNNRQIDSAKYRYVIKSYKNRGHYRLIFTDEIKSFIKDNCSGKLIGDLTVQVNKKFNTEFSDLQIRNHLDDYRLTSGVDTKFKVGNQHFKWKSAGEERVDGRGRAWVKISDTEKIWKLKSHVVWEEANGEITNGHVLMYLDRDETNWELDNLVAVDRSTLSVVVSRDALIVDEPLFNLVSVSHAKLNGKIRELEAGD